MLNEVVIMGRIAQLPTHDRDLVLRNTAVDNTISNIDVYLDSTSMINNINNYCKENDLIAVKGKLKEIDCVLKVYGQKVTFLSTKGGTVEHG